MDGQMIKGKTENSHTKSVYEYLPNYYVDTMEGPQVT